MRTGLSREADLGRARGRLGLGGGLFGVSGRLLGALLLRCRVGLYRTLLRFGLTGGLGLALLSSSLYAMKWTSSRPGYV